MRAGPWSFRALAGFITTLAALIAGVASAPSAAAAGPSASVADVAVTEGGTATFTIRLSEPATTTVRVRYSTADGNAIAPGDYTATGATVEIPAGTRTWTVPVPTVADDRDEEDEVFHFLLAEVEGATVDDGTAVARVADDDPTPQLTLAGVTIGESDAARQVTLTATLSAPTEKNVSFQYRTEDVTASSASDYGFRSAAVFIPSGGTSFTFTVPVQDDAVDEADETFRVVLFDVFNAVGGGPANVTILDDDLRGPGYWLTASDGGVFSYGDARFFGSTGALTLTQPIVAMASTPTGNGYWLAAADGGIFAYGDARFFGSTGALPLVQPVVGFAPTRTGLGYWLVAADGGIFAFGDARFFGSTGGLPLAKPIVGFTPTPTSNGYWLVAADGGIFAFGDAGFFGSTGALTLAKPIVAMAPTRTGAGYWLAAADGGIFAFGDARFHGSTGAIALTRPIVAMSPTPSGGGYRLVASDGGVFTFGDARFLGSAGALRLVRPVVAMATLPPPL